MLNGQEEQIMTEQTNLLRRITARPEVFGGKPIIRDMRISVELVLSLLAQGVTPEAILDDYPDLEPDDIRACTAYAHAIIARDTLSAVTVAER
jgi:uncharacterized protein (DUF433 family)